MKNGWGTVGVALSVVLSAALFSYAFRTRSRANHEVTVVGSGTKNFEADLISWTGHFTRKGTDLKETFNLLNADRERVRTFLVSKGAPEKDVVFSSIKIDKEFDDVRQKDGSTSQKFSGYRLSQSVQIDSTEVDKFERISREISDLINAGVELTSNTPEYFFTKLSELKIEMVAAATRDAHERAVKIVENAGGHLGKLSHAALGVFQITAQNSSEEFSWKGSYNTASRRKTATVTLRLEYEVD